MARAELVLQPNGSFLMHALPSAHRDLFQMTPVTPPGSKGAVAADPSGGPDSGLAMYLVPARTARSFDFRRFLSGLRKAKAA